MLIPVVGIVNQLRSRFRFVSAPSSWLRVRHDVEFKGADDADAAVLSLSFAPLSSDTRADG